MAGKVNRTSRAFIRNRGDAARAVRGIEKKLKAVTAELERQSEKALREVAEEIRDEALPLTPKDTGALRRSAFVDSQTTTNGAEAVVGFNKQGSGDADYAVFVHEMPATNTFTTPGTGPKFLQIAADRVQQRILAEVAAKMRKMFDGG